MTYKQFDVVVVPFPFTDLPVERRRPALVLSSPDALGDRIGHSVLAMITSLDNSPWPLDVPVNDLDAAGLPAPSKVRMKLFTLDHRIIDRRIGALAASDQTTVTRAMKKLIPLQ